MDEHVLATYLRTEETFVDGLGAVLRDANGHEYLDFLGGIAVSALGHRHPRLVAALQRQCDALLHTSNLYRHPFTDQLAARLAEHTGLAGVFFTNSGAEAVEAALKIARKEQRRRGQIHRTGWLALEGSFHGRTFGALSVTHTAKYRQPFEPLVPGVAFVAANDEDVLRRAIEQHRPAALILEPIQGESGIRRLDDAYLRACRQICNETGTLLIHDEVQSGCGRTGMFLSADHAGVKPDIVTLAKPLAGGLPMGAAIVARSLTNTLQPGDHGSTFAGGPLVCCAALVFLDELDAGLQAQVVARGATLTRELDGIVAEFPLVLERRGLGLMQGLRLGEPLIAADLQNALYQRRLITNACGNNVLRLLPPYVVSDAQIEHAADILRQELLSLAGAHS